MMNFFKKKIGTAVIIIAAIAALSAAVTHFTGINPVSAAVHTVFSPFRSGISAIAGAIDKQVTFLREARAYKEENEWLVDEIIRLKKKNKEISVYQEENERLTSLLELKNSMTGYSTVAAAVIGFSSGAMYDKIEINKGSLSGVSEGNTVITADGVVGIVTDAGPNWAIIDTIINPGSATGIIVARTGDIGVIEGDEEMCRNSLCKLTFVDKGANIIVGDILETSGSGGIYPPGLDIGTINEISADNMGMLNYASVEPSVDFRNLHEVLIINGVQ